MIAVQNMEKLIPLKKEALESPLAFVEKLQRGEHLDFPVPQVIAEVSFKNINFRIWKLKIDINYRFLK